MYRVYYSCYRVVNGVHASERSSPKACPLCSRSFCLEREGCKTQTKDSERQREVAEEYVGIAETKDEVGGAKRRRQGRAEKWEERRRRMTVGGRR